MRILVLSVLLSFTMSGIAQVVNGYAQVTGISGNVLTLGTVDESADTFEDDEWIVIMQMQDNNIGMTGNNINFGNLGSIQNTGVYEVRNIQSHTESAGTPTTITLANNPNFTYNFNTHSSVQIITLRQFGSPDYTTTGNMSAKSWDGTTGGVLAIYTPGILTLNHNLSADLNGFRGAGPNAGGAAGCSGASNYRVSTQDNFADKGEGIYKRTAANQAAGMGKILNGGGGGNSHNGGGGGGGNYTAGGDGGPGWPTCSPSAGGQGGLSLQANISADRVFMGGGGGAGEGNNNLSTDGGDGGGIILLKATEIVTNSCSGVTISANGQAISFAGNDGGGGGGAGGSIVFEVDLWNVSGGCPLSIQANGGNGGGVNNSATHGGGGGGGQGVIIYKNASPTTNITTETLNGVGGCNNSSVPCNSQAGSGSGADGDGVLSFQSGPLPIELISFNGQLNNDKVDLFWTTKSEANNDFFTVEHSINGSQWNAIDMVKGAGNSVSTLHYTSQHLDPNLGINYYRLKQTDFNGLYNYSDAISIVFEEDHTVVYPNPAINVVNIFKPNIINYEIVIYNSLGQIVEVIVDLDQDLAQINIQNLENGIYFAQLNWGDQQEFIRFLIER